MIAHDHSRPQHTIKAMHLKNLINSALTRPTLAAAIVTVVPALLLAAAFVFQYGVGLAPCVLCVYQRWPYAAIIAVGLVAFVLGRRGHAKPAAALIFLTALIFIGESILAAYHVGVEHRWWASVFEGCSTGFDIAGGGSILDKIESTAAVRCDAVAWSLFGISMAGYNALIAFAMGIYAAVASIMVTRKANGF
ncbi:disulfide bond formation protein B [Micavibrio aeruginosavorus]|uniref:disulfide bond formation protein B n=1 Tax=Micavibrio aeruginosavorus TaxID=349221 RepID=UPI003F4AD63B